jgi:hypothetical protein
MHFIFFYLFSQIVATGLRTIQFLFLKVTLSPLQNGEKTRRLLAQAHAGQRNIGAQEQSDAAKV